MVEVERVHVFITTRIDRSRYKKSEKNSNCAEASKWTHTVSHFKSHTLTWPWGNALKHASLQYLS
jgi:hypothetical protein